MDRTLLEHRHPALGALLRLWMERSGRAAMLTAADLGPLEATVLRLRRDGDGRWPAAEGAARGSEAATAAETQRPLLIEDGTGSRRSARLYLPLTDDDGGSTTVLCGVGAIPP